MLRDQAQWQPGLDGMGCQVIMQRAKFTPAKDREDGKPIRSNGGAEPTYHLANSRLALTGYGPPSKLGSVRGPIC